MKKCSGTLHMAFLADANQIRLENDKAVLNFYEFFSGDAD